ncbi:hypothetical protein AB3331_09360 [Streptococcus sp. H49]|uniref:hypothetical protein n=1 Tax=Streptococcus huangxiaojuni TaxID=3237239 RepID=UPI0034A26F64
MMVYFYLKERLFILEKKVDFDSNKLTFHVKQKILVAFLDLLYEHDSGIYSLVDAPIELSHGIISEIPEEIVQEYEEIRLNYEARLKQLIKKIEELPANSL